MENASKALLIAAEILIAVLIATMFAVLFSTMSDYSKEYESKKQTEEIQAFNAQFLQYTQNATAQDVLTVANMAQSYNTQNGYEKEDEEYYIKICLGSNEIEADGIKSSLTELKGDFDPIDNIDRDNIKNNLILYSVQEITYSNVTGKINKIVYQKNS